MWAMWASGPPTFGITFFCLLKSPLIIDIFQDWPTHFQNRSATPPPPCSAGGGGGGGGTFGISGIKNFFFSFFPGIQNPRKSADSQRNLVPELVWNTTNPLANLQGATENH